MKIGRGELQWLYVIVSCCLFDYTTWRDNKYWIRLDSFWYRYSILTNAITFPHSWCCYYSYIITLCNIIVTEVMQSYSLQINNWLVWFYFEGGGGCLGSEHTAVPDHYKSAVCLTDTAGFDHSLTQTNLHTALNDCFMTDEQSYRSIMGQNKKIKNNFCIKNEKNIESS